MSSSDAELLALYQASLENAPDAEWTEVACNGENYRIFPQAGLAMLNSLGQYFTLPRYFPVRPDGGLGRVVSRRYSRAQFQHEDWTQVGELYVDDCCVLSARFTHHQFELLMGAENYYLM